jgi:homoserine dehydrogenase
MDTVRVALVGLGTVGRSLHALLTANAERLARRVGARIEIAWVGVRDPSRARPVGAPTRLVKGFAEILDDPTVQIVIEMVGGIDAPLELIRGALSRGKHVITANKALLALHGAELFNLAGRMGVELKFEASVCGGIPIVKVLRESLFGNSITAIQGIVNGTTNYILTRMTEENLPYEQALRQAQEKGFAEADPTLDVGGGDAAQKISILASIAFGCWIDWRAILCEGIQSVSPSDIEFCRSAGYVFKLIAQARLADGRPLVTVYPALVPLDHPLAAVRGEYNAVMVDADFLGPSVYEGRGAGGDPTASSVASDLGDLVRMIVTRSGPRPRAEVTACASLSPVESMRSRCYFHFVTANRPGIWALVTGICAEDGINIESVHQKWEDKSLPSDLYVLVDEAEEAQVRRAFGRIVSSDGIFPQSRYYRVLAGPGEG